MLKQRVATALVLGAGFTGILFALPAIFFQIFIVCVCLIGAWEWSNLAAIAKPSLRAAYALAIATLLLALWGLCEHYALATPLMSAAIVWWGIALLWVQGYPSSVVFWQNSSIRLLLGVCVLIPTGLALLLLRGMVNGDWLILALLIIVACADSGAYFTGKAFGKRKLAPKVSPGKSWEGVVGGFLLVGLVAGVFGWLYHNNIQGALIVALPAAAISVLGDLLESMLKRHRGIKDSGNILPGHGGVLDRIDGVTSAAPIFLMTVLSTGWAI